MKISRNKLVKITDEDVTQWKTNPVTKAFIKMLEISVTGINELLLNGSMDNLLCFGRLQGNRFSTIEIYEAIKDADHEELMEVIIEFNKQLEETEDESY